MPDHDIVVVGASAGGVEALIRLVASVPAQLPAAVFVVLHVPPSGTSALPDILGRSGPLPAGHVKDGEPIEHGRIYVAPPDHHLLLRPGHVHLARGPRENGHRPAVDPLFRSAAREYATRVVGMVLSGALDDGTAGLVASRARGGLAVVQDPADALYSGMPVNALHHVAVDHVLPATAMGGCWPSWPPSRPQSRPGRLRPT
jgi:two-component system, chemotaxis family, protein-glutamate methylesterase/glutaminase